MVKARTRVAASDGKTSGVNKRADFRAELGGGGFHCRLQVCSVEVLQRGECITDGEEVRFVRRDEMFRDALEIVTDVVREIETAIRRKLAEDLELAFAGIERGPNVIRRERC